MRSFSVSTSYQVIDDFDYSENFLSLSKIESQKRNFMKLILDKYNKIKELCERDLW